MSSVFLVGRAAARQPPGLDRRVFTRARDTYQMVIATNAWCRANNPPETAIQQDQGRIDFPDATNPLPARARDRHMCPPCVCASGMELARRAVRPRWRRYAEVAITGSPARTHDPRPGRRASRSPQGRRRGLRKIASGVRLADGAVLSNKLLWNDRRRTASAARAREDARWPAL